MTVLVWDGDTLATDRQANDGSLAWESSKAWYISGKTGVCIATGVGMLKDIIVAREWWKEGGQPSHWPFSHTTNNCQFIVVDGGGLHLFDGTPYPETRAFTPCAFGHGRDFAYGALAMGANAKEAVEAANKYSLHCGIGVELFTLHRNGDV